MGEVIEEKRHGFGRGDVETTGIGGGGGGY